MIVIVEFKWVEELADDIILFNLLVNTVGSEQFLTRQVANGTYY